MVKKRLLSGEACKKCVQAEETLKGRGLWERIDTIIWAEEGNPDSEGMLEAARLNLELAPFFVVRDAAEERVYTSVIKFIKAELSDESSQGVDASVGQSLVTQVQIDELLAGSDALTAEAVLSFALSKQGGEMGIAFSGAEDVILIDIASKLGVPFQVFCLDTGRLHAETYRFIEKVRKHYGIDIEMMSPDPVKLQPFIRQKGLFSFYEDGHQECCGVRKVEPLKRKLATLGGWITGQRKDQSPATRSEIPLIAFDEAFSAKYGQLLKLNPLANWTSSEVWQYIEEHRVPFNELHQKGYISIGCEPCTRATKPGEHERAGRWWWEESTHRECGLHQRR